MIRIVTINVGESEKQIQPTIQKFGMDDYALLMDYRGIEMKRWNVYGFPTNFVIGKNGELALGSFGAVPWDEPDVRCMMDALF